MARHARLRHSEHVHEFLDRELFAFEQREDSHAGRVEECLEHALQRLDGHDLPQLLSLAPVEGNRDAMCAGSTQVENALSSRSISIVVVVLLLAAIPGIAVHLGTLVVPEDDAFIVYRYVDHLTRGVGLVYNEGERVFGVTSPLYVAWLAALKTAFPDVRVFFFGRLFLQDDGTDEPRDKT